MGHELTVKVLKYSSICLKEKFMLNIFKRKIKSNKESEKELFDYFRIEKTNGEVTALGDFANKNFVHWLPFIHDMIQNAMNTKKLKVADVKNYVNITLYIGGQRVDIALVKDGHPGPHELLRQIRKKGSEG
jgi:hypothetical protein